ncbi:MAG: hypothetical protein LUF30_05420, partial [Lachnospiraceae bacterium]|nr:hypothetical protein [Lachnospiraceae bacterium]
NDIADTDAPENQMENIMPYVEENYSVSSNPEDRAYAGYSLGAKIAAEIYLAYPEEFAYFGLWSVSQDLTLMERDEDGDLSFANVMVGMGMYDTTIISYGNIPKFIQSLHQLGIDYDFYTYGGAHDFNFWQRMFTIFVRDYMNEK